MAGAASPAAIDSAGTAIRAANKQVINEVETGFISGGVMVDSKGDLAMGARTKLDKKPGRNSDLTQNSLILQWLGGQSQI